MESMTLYAASLVDRDKKADVRLEAAMCKLFGTERAWEIADDAMQIRGGRGYETASSLKARGEAAIPVERFLRDCRINTIFEGSSEIMRLFIAREALDPHLKVSGAALNSQLPRSHRLKAALKAGMFYARWYPRQFLPSGASNSRAGVPPAHPVLAKHLRYASRTSRRLARRLFHAMIRFGPKLEREQVLLGRFVEIGTELYAMAASCSRAQALLARGSKEQNAGLLGLVDYFCVASRLRIERAFRGVSQNVDRQGYRLAQQVLREENSFLEEGIVRHDF